MQLYRKLSFLFFVVACFFNAVAQSDDFYKQGGGSESGKYFVSIGYGLGGAWWNSSIGNTGLFDRNGNQIEAGKVAFTANNPISLVNMEILLPVNRLHLGFGISFEKNSLSELTLRPDADSPDGNTIVYDQDFSFVKMYLLIEVPLTSGKSKNYMISFKGNAGYFGYSGATHLNFFGDNNLANAYCANAGLIAAYKVYNHLYVFLNPSVEYKYYRNETYEGNGLIAHNIGSISVVGGIRLDVSRK
jgi:hypothetical protein